jgi:hypothetical protein
MFAVIAGLDPAIHRAWRFLRSVMDTRVKPAYDESKIETARAMRFATNSWAAASAAAFSFAQIAS